MKFVHFADSHIDGFKDPRLADLGLQSFSYVIDYAIKESVDFVLIAGDLFNTALPRLEALEFVVEQLSQLQKNNIPIYAIAGSHDASARGKTMIDILALTGLLINVMQGDIDDNEKLHLKWTIDAKTNAHITGISGKKGQLDSVFYKQLAPLQLPENAPTIFLFHGAITQLQPPELATMQSQDIAYLPSGCDYYAGGHVHIKKSYSDTSHKAVVFPGPTFPNNFSELEKLKTGSFVFYDDTQKQKFSHVPIPSQPVIVFTVNAQDKTPQQVTQELFDLVTQNVFEGALVLLRIQGTLLQGTPSDIDMQQAIQELYSAGAYMVLKNTYALRAHQFEEQESAVAQGASSIEETIVSQYSKENDTLTLVKEQEKIHQLLNSLALEPADGEKKTAFVERVIHEIEAILEK
ncbi:MAG: metallophosphoesterase family protein [Candidatus Nanoarchaeia archaeon]